MLHSNCSPRSDPNSLDGGLPNILNVLIDVVGPALPHEFGVDPARVVERLAVVQSAPAGLFLDATLFAPSLSFSIMFLHSFDRFVHGRILRLGFGAISLVLI